MAKRLIVNGNSEQPGKAMLLRFVRDVRRFGGTQWRGFRQQPQYQLLAAAKAKVVEVPGSEVRP